MQTDRGLRVRRTEAEDEVLRDQNGLPGKERGREQILPSWPLKRNPPWGHLALRPLVFSTVRK